MKSNLVIAFIFMSGLLAGQGITLLIQGNLVAFALLFGAGIQGYIGVSSLRQRLNAQVSQPEPKPITQADQ